MQHTYAAHYYADSLYTYKNVCNKHVHNTRIDTCTAHKYIQTQHTDIHNTYIHKQQACTQTNILYRTIYA